MILFLFTEIEFSFSDLLASLIDLRKLVSRDNKFSISISFGKGLNINLLALESLKEITFFIVLKSKSKYFISFYEAGNVGNTLLEAMRLGCIPIVRNTGLTENTIVNGQNGFCLPGDELELLQIANTRIKSIVEIDETEILKNVKQFSDLNINTWEKRINKEIVFIKK